MSKTETGSFPDFMDLGRALRGESAKREEVLGALSDRLAAQRGALEGGLAPAVHARTLSEIGALQAAQAIVEVFVRVMGREDEARRSDHG